MVAYASMIPRRMRVIATSSDRTKPAYHRQYYTSQQAAAYLGLSNGYLSILRSAGQGPRYYRLAPTRSGQVRYDRDDLDAWMRAHQQGGEIPPTTQG
jgi:Helix-turn-helix domain